MRSANDSTWPYSIVELLRMPSECATRWTLMYSSPDSFLSAIVARTPGLNTSAPPPGIVSSPASRSAISVSRTDIFSMRAMCAISTAVSALM